jgi:hypothetical protein
MCARIVPGHVNRGGVMGYETDRNREFDASDPYDEVAVIYTAFMCQGCPAIYDGNPSENRLLPYHVVGQEHDTPAGCGTV